MPHTLESNSLAQANDCPQSWTKFFQDHCDSLFQTALLLSADPKEAEASVAATLDIIDLAKAPDERQVVCLQEALAKRTIQAAPSSPESGISEARNLLQVELRPVLEIERSPRICFVLRTLLGYATSACAQVLGIEESTVRTLLETAMLQLQSTVSGTNWSASWADSADAEHRLSYSGSAA